MNGLQAFPLQQIKIEHEDQEIALTFRSAVLYVDVSDLVFSWFVDISYMDQYELLEKLSSSRDIQIRMAAVSKQGEQLSGSGFMHPNLPASSASIRGDGILFGYETF